MELVNIKIKELYHGTTKECANSITANGFKLTSWNFNSSTFKDKPGTLGYGIYAFSQSFICEKYVHEKIKDNRVIILIKLNLDHLNIFDLTNEEHNEIYQKFRERFMEKQIYKELRKKLKNGNQSELEGIMLEYLIKHNSEKLLGFKECDCVKSWTISVLSDTINTKIPNGIEYCIRKVESIVEVEIWKED